MNYGDKIRNMNNKELSEEIFKWHELLFGNKYRFNEDIEKKLDEPIPEEQMSFQDAIFDELNN